MKEKALHINCKELLAAYYLEVLKEISKINMSKHFQIINKTRIFSNYKKIGRTKSSICNDIVKNIWLFCVKNRIWITAKHFPGAENVIADYESRISYKDAEWMLNPEIFQKAIKHLKFKPNLDAYLIDAFSSHWGFYKCYLFPPNPSKDSHDQTEVILVIPKWPTQPWFNTFQGMLSHETYVVLYTKRIYHKKQRSCTPCG